MKYPGSKARYAKEILPIVLANRKPGQWYVEPFVGGGNMIAQVKGNRLGSDVNKYVVSMLDALSRGWEPPEAVPEDEYKNVRQEPDRYDSAYVGFVGVGCSYSGKWFGGYARGNDANGKARNYADESRRNAIKQAAGLHGALFVSMPYTELSIPANSIVYCDPPYASTTGYGVKFDSDGFWRWCDRQVDKGHQVFVSEYTAPPHWRCVWAKEGIASSLDKNTGGKRATEKLFTRE